METEQLDVILASVLPRYDIKVRGIAPLDGHTCLLDTDRGLKRLRLDTDERRVLRRHALWEHLAKGGFRRIPRHIRSLYGEALVTEDDCIYTLSDDWEGRVPEVIPLDMRLAGRNLARLHSAVKGLQLPEEIAMPKRHGTWLERFSKAGDDLEQRHRMWTDVRQKNQLQEQFLASYDWISEQIGSAVEGLVAGKYEETASRAEQEDTFAVGDYRLSDLRIDWEGRVATLHIDDAIADLPLYDAAKFAHGLIERGENDMANLFLDGYAEEAGLSQNEIVILDSYFTFPHAAYRHLMQYSRLKKGADVFAERLTQAVQAGQTRGPMLYGSGSARWT
jgi:CotS family spore coat protein